MGDWYTIGLALGLGVGLGILAAGVAGARRAAVLAAIAEAGVPQDRVLDGGECRDGVTGRGGDNAEAVFVAMGRRDEFAAYMGQR